MRPINLPRIQAHLLVLQERFKEEKPIFQLCCAAVALGKLQISLINNCLGYLLTFISAFYEFFSLTSNSIFLFHLWRPITACFMETNLGLAAWSMLAFHQLTHIIEPVWGLQEVVKFSLIVQVGYLIC
jgi:hypothetical protein